MASGDLERGKNISNNNNNRSSYSSGSYYVEPGSDQQWTSWLIPMFVVANVAVFIVAMYINNCPKNNWEGGRGCVARFLGRLSFEPLKENPLFGPSSSTLQKLGALEWDRVVHEHQGWRLITCIWLHAGVIHLLANMLSLVFIGIRLEQQFGFGMSQTFMSLNMKFSLTYKIVWSFLLTYLSTYLLKTYCLTLVLRSLLF